LSGLDAFLIKTADRLNSGKRKWFFIFFGWRLLLLLLMVVSQATVLQQGQWTQYLYFRTVVQLTDSGYYPLIGHWIEYPPVFPWLSAILYQLASLVGNEMSKFVIFYGLLALVFVLSECGILYYIYKMGRIIYDDQRAMIAALIFAFTSPPTYIIYGWFDPIAAFFLFWGLERLLQGRNFQSALAAALGGLTKLFPLILLAVGFRILPTLKAKIGYVATTLLLTALPFVAFVFVNAEAVIASLRWLANKSTYQTVWALIDGYYSYGMAPGAADFIDLSAAEWIAHPTRIPWTAVTLLFGLIGLYIYTRPLNLEVKQTAVVLSGIIIQMMILYLKGFSPQFIIWFLPLVPLIMPNGRGLLYSIGLAGLNLLEFPIYFTFLEDGTQDEAG
jgi:hypothetical protein